MAKRSAKARPPSRVLTDPRAIRALAHPARLAVLDALSGGVELTATQMAERAGVSPSAMSYHLRALEKWGIVERAESDGDGRERPWRAYPGGWGIEALPDAATAAATSAVTGLLMSRLSQELSEWFAEERTQPKQWRDVSGVDNRAQWFTAEELLELQTLYRDYIDARSHRTANDHPEGARRVRVSRVVVPLQTE